MPRIAIVLMLALFAFVPLSVSSSGEAMFQRVDDCPSNAVRFRGRNRALTCHCTARRSDDGSVWGTSVYSENSRICRAAVHDGRISERGGNVRIVFLGARASYQGSRRNGVRSRGTGRAASSFRFAGGNFGGQPDYGNPDFGDRRDCPSDATQYRGGGQRSCFCDSGSTRNGRIWGTRVYAQESRICRAALHAGVIGDRGGLVTFDLRGGQFSYEGSRRNGVRSRDYGRSARSIDFRGGGNDYVPPNSPYPPLRPDPGGEVRNCAGNGLSLRASPGGVTCRCTRTGVSGGQVFGTDVYSERSAICRAALHAGVVGRNGGVVRVVSASGRNQYRGSQRNGVSTQQAGPAQYSFRFRR